MVSNKCVNFKIRNGLNFHFTNVLYADHLFLIKIDWIACSHHHSRECTNKIEESSAQLFIQQPFNELKCKRGI
jgi:hypothetical protein